MYIPDILNELDLEKYLEQQRKHAWDINKDITWNKGIDLTKPFLALGKDATFFPKATPRQRLVISQYMGLLINSTICELENALERSKTECWVNLIRKYPVNPEFIALGEEFFKDEKKHSDVFNKFLKMFAEETNVTYQELQSLLPVLDKSKIESLFRVNSIVGGQALWWVVAAVEEESIMVYKHMHKFKKNLDPLFYEIHRRHFEEETRHAAYAFLMLDLFRRRANSPVNLLAKKLDFIFSEILQITWIMKELLKLINVKKLADRHPFYKTLEEALPMISEFSPNEIIQKLFLEDPYISMILNPRNNKNLQESIDQIGSFTISRGTPDKVDLTIGSEREVG
ncbi:MAG: hypothetical protein HOJ35_05515 [Bdellovibrionales bacterium]|jgi:hypothetical protein|nr:hypothetical protein [Bdellovibrionales bacterium]